MTSEEKIITLLEIVVGKIDNLEYKMDNLEYKFDNLEFKVDGQEYKVDSIDRRMEKLEGRQAQVREEIVARLETAEERHTKAIEKQVAYVIECIAKLEERLAGVFSE